MAPERALRTARRDKVHARPDLLVAQVADDAWAILTSAELQACGLTRNGIARRRRDGHLHLLHRGVYAVGHPTPPWQGRLLAAVKACGPGAVASRFSAAALAGFLDYEEDRAPEVLVVGQGPRRHRGIRCRRTASLHPKDRARTQNVPVTSVPRTLLDLAATLDGRPLRSAVRRAQGMRLVTIRQIAEVIRRLGPCRGSNRLASAIATGHAPTRSVLEDIVLDLILEAGFEHPDVNQPLQINGRKVIPDFRWPAQRLTIEADSRAWHDDPLASEDDAERQALLEATGENVLRITYRQAVLHPAQSIERIRSAGAPAPSSDSPTA